MESVWKVYGKKDDFYGIGKRFGIDPVIARVIRNRDITGIDNIDKYLNCKDGELYNPRLLKDAEKAADIVREKIKEEKHIRIIGDYDIDGVMSIYILLTGLKEAGACVDYVIPHRVNDGYGINEQLIQDAYEDGVDTIITCDNGIAAVAQIDYAKEKGMTVIVTDHHDVQYTEENGSIIYRIPRADAVINPKQPDCGYPFKKLCGAAVAYKFICVLYEICGIDRGQSAALLEYAAIATVGDVMDIIDENRCIVQYGLKLLNHTNNVGLKNLISVNGLEGKNISAYHIGFVIGPCLNASGRLDTAKWALELLLSSEQERAHELAEKLKAFNDERKSMTAYFCEQAFDLIESTDMKQDNVLVVYLEECHESIAGIIAGRIREKYYKPALVLTKAAEGIKGSGRSIEGYNMFEGIRQCEDLLSKWGGHKMAAGVSLEEKNMEEFRRRLNENAGLTEKELTETIWIDAPMPIDYVSEKLVQQLELLEPFGKGNEKPVFADKNLKIRYANLMGKDKNVFKTVLEDGNGYTVDAVSFLPSGEEAELPKKGDMVSALYYPSLNEYRGERMIQLVVKEYRKQ